MAGLIEEQMGGAAAEKEDRESAGAPADSSAVTSGISVPPELQEQFERMVLAGRKVMYSGETHEMALGQIDDQPGSMGERLGKAMAGLMSLLFSESGGALPPQLLIPAGFTLMADAADFLNESGGEGVTNDDLAEAMGVFMETLFKALGVDPEQLRQEGAGGFEQPDQAQPDAQASQPEEM